jgi:hypothetical protein
MKTKLITKAEYDRLDGPGLTRLRRSPKAKAIREAIIADQAAGTRSARDRWTKAAQDAPQAATDAPSPALAPSAPAEAPSPPAARPAAPAKAVIAPTPIPVPAEKMEGMSAKTAAAFMRAAKGQLPESPDLSAPSTSPSDRKELAALTAMAEAGDVAGLRAYGIRPYYSGAIKLDRYRQLAIIAIEARRVGKD